MSAAELDGAWWIVRDEREGVELLDKSDAAHLRPSAHRVEQFDSRDAWLGALEQIRRRANPARRVRADAPAPAHRIPNDRLAESDLPAPDAPWAEISRFAGSFNGDVEHGGRESLVLFGRAMRDIHESGWKLPGNLDALRSALFYEQRSDHFADSPDDPATLAYIHALVEALREALHRRSAGDDRRAAHDPIAVCLPAVAEHLLSRSLPAVGGDMRALREAHLNQAVRAELSDHLAVEVASNVLPVVGWPSLGRSSTDFVAVGFPGPAVHVGELKWCQASDDKVYEAIWDLFKMALSLQRPGVRTAHLISGAPADMWPRAFCADLFDGGTFTVEELCARRFAVGSRRLAWDYLLEGGYDRCPERVPAHVTTRPVAEPVKVAAGGQAWELRAVAVSYVTDLPDVPFEDGWPHGWRPADARRPAGGTPLP